MAPWRRPAQAVLAIFAALAAGVGAARAGSHQRLRLKAGRRAGAGWAWPDPLGLFATRAPAAAPPAAQVAPTLPPKTEQALAPAAAPPGLLGQPGLAPAPGVQGLPGWVERLIRQRAQQGFGQEGPAAPPAPAALLPPASAVQPAPALADDPPQPVPSLPSPATPPLAEQPTAPLTPAVVTESPTLPPLPAAMPVEQPQQSIAPRVPDAANQPCAQWMLCTGTLRPPPLPAVAGPASPLPWPSLAVTVQFSPGAGIMTAPPQAAMATPPQALPQPLAAQQPALEPLPQASPPQQQQALAPAPAEPQPPPPPPPQTATETPQTATETPPQLLPQPLAQQQALQPPQQALPPQQEQASAPTSVKLQQPPQAPHLPELAALSAQLGGLRQQVEVGRQEMWEAMKLVSTAVDQHTVELKALARDMAEVHGARPASFAAAPPAGTPTSSASDACALRQSSCAACSAELACVWCEVEQRCLQGDAFGPAAGECQLFRHGTCA